MDQSLKQSATFTQRIQSIPTAWMIYAIVVFGVLIRVLAVAFLTQSGVPLQSDSLSYYEVAQEYANGRYVAPFWPPGLPYYLKLVFEVFGMSEVVARYAMIPFYVLLVMPLYLLVRDLVSVRAANLAVLLFTLYPTYIYHSVYTLTHLPVAAYLMVIAYLTYLVAEKPEAHWKVLRLVLLGMVAMLMILTRAGSISVLAVVIPYLLLRTRNMIWAAIPVMVMGVLLAIYTLLVYQINEEFIIVNYGNSYNLFLGNNEHTPLYKTWQLGTDLWNSPQGVQDTYWFINSHPADEQDSLYRQEAMTHITARPDLFVIRTLSRMRAFWGFDTFTGSRIITEGIGGQFIGLATIAIDALFYFVIMIPAFGFFFLQRIIFEKFPRPFALFIVGVVLFYAVPYFIAFSHATYHIPIVPLVSVLAVATLDSLPKVQGQLLQLGQVGWQQRLFLVALVIFAAIQMEWAIVMASEFLGS